MNKQDKDIVVKKIKVNHKKLKDFGILKVGIFGSFARGQASETSDIDLLVKFAKEKKPIVTSSVLQTLLNSC